MTLKNVLKRILRFVLAVAFFYALWCGFVYWHNLPPAQTVIKVPGLLGKVSITRDQFGVPHIIADKSDYDAFFALGYVHAQDRFWQMEFQRRVAQGTLSELFGQTTLKQDEYLRTWGFYRAAKSAWPALSPQAQQIVQAYTNGVNAYLKQGHLPLQIRLFGYHPKPWTVIDSIAWQKMLAWDLQNSWEQKLKNQMATQEFGADQVPIFYPPYPNNGPLILSNADLAQSKLIAVQPKEALLSNAAKVNTQKVLSDMATTAQTVRRELNFQDVPSKGSNNWVVSGRFTESGKPLLANDPHLALQAPALWYLVDMQGPHIHVVGATIPGMPGVVIGHNDHIAWGVTNVNPDTQDLYILPDNATVQANQEIIKVRQHDDVPYTVLISDVGPVISTVTAAGRLAPLVALKWTALLPGDTTMQSMLALNYAQNWTQFVDALRTFVTPSQNFVYADIDGNIGYYLPGKIPIRHWNSSLPVPDDAQHQWSGYIPFDQLPHVYNPPEGMIVSANNQAVSDVYPFLLKNRWAEPPYRAQRILDLIKQLQPLNISKCETMQLDTVSTLWQSFAPVLLNTKPLDKQSELALTILKNWDGKSPLQSTQQTIFAYWYRQLKNLTPPSLSIYSKWPEPLFLLQQLQDNGKYCVRKDANNCQEYLSKSLQLAMQDLTKDLGNDPNKWQWERVHRADFYALGFGPIPLVKKIWNRHISTPGGLYTVDVGTYDMKDFVQHDGPSYRQIVDLSNLDASKYVLTLGQSDDFVSNHYEDQLKMWRDGKYLPMSSNPADWGESNEITLVPAG